MMLDAAGMWSRGSAARQAHSRASVCCYPARLHASLVTSCLSTYQARAAALLSLTPRNQDDLRLRRWMMTDQTADEPRAADTGVAAQIGGLCVLKGTIIYAATLTFSGFYIYFMLEIFQAHGKPPSFDPAMVSASAALAGVLGSAFALVIGLPTDKNAVNTGIQEAIDNAAKPKEKIVPWLRKILSYEPRNAQSSSWPMTFGIWAYALVASGVAVTYFLNQNQTPDAIKTLAVAFAGYVIALLTSVYQLTTNGA
jgi:hypothetical protein